MSWKDESSKKSESLSPCDFASKWVLEWNILLPKYVTEMVKSFRSCYRNSGSFHNLILFDIGLFERSFSSNAFLELSVFILAFSSIILLHKFVMHLAVETELHLNFTIVRILNMIACLGTLLGCSLQHGTPLNSPRKLGRSRGRLRACWAAACASSAGQARWCSSVLSWWVGNWPYQFRGNNRVLAPVLMLVHL